MQINPLVDLYRLCIGVYMIKLLLSNSHQSIKEKQQSEHSAQQRRSFRRDFIVLIFLLVSLLLADYLCYQQALPVTLDEQGGNTILHVGSESIALGSIGTPIALQLAPYDPIIHEYQIDGSDSTNNFTLDTTYLHSIASSPYYRFQAWMRNLDGTSRWSDLRIYNNGSLLTSQNWPANGTTILLHSVPPPSAVQSPEVSATSLHVQLLLRRPETPMTLNLMMADNTTIQITLDRNNRKITVTHSVNGQSSQISSTFFPVDALPFAMMVLDTLIRTMLWAILVLLGVLICEGLLALFGEIWTQLIQSRAVEASQEEPASLMPDRTKTKITGNTRSSFIIRWWHNVVSAIHPVALVALLGSLCFVAWIAYVQYHAEPHIYDASAYLFSAKMYAAGHLSAPIPPAADRFPGPFMVQYAGRWFGQYPPGTGLTLVPGIWLGVPWLVEPLLGTLALFGIGLVAARLYDRRVATLAILLGVLSPFYSYLAASYLSHTVALFYLVWGVWALMRFLQDEEKWNLPLAVFLFGMAALTRDLVAILFVATIATGLMILFWRKVRAVRAWWSIPGFFSIGVILVFVCISLGFNDLLTHNPLVTSRTLFFAGDRFGFGQGIGFYGQHTLAAGFVNLDELLTALAIDLYGWPFYLTLAFCLLPFLTRRARGADWFCLISAIILTSAYIGYFYHGIYLGPRYLFEALPFLLILTARGILTLGSAGIDIGQALRNRWRASVETVLPRATISIPTFTLVTLLVLCNLLYFLPRQIELHRNFSSLPPGYQIDLDEVYHPPIHNAIVVTNDYTIYQLVLFPLNDPQLHNDVIYAWINSTADYTELRAAFPYRKLYHLDISPNGSVHYTEINTATLIFSVLVTLLAMKQ